LEVSRVQVVHHDHLSHRHRSAFGSGPCFRWRTLERWT
jgi:hypothetical protein